MTSERYDLFLLINLRRKCHAGIVTGNWDGYSDNLIIRKKRLREYDKEIEELKAKINQNEKV
jgi:hypothetical protein